MKPPTSTLGKAAVALVSVFGASWLGAAINSRRVAKQNPAGASAAATIGAVTGGMMVTAAGAGLALTKSDWKEVGAFTALAGSGSYAISAVLGIGPVDRILEKAAQKPQALTATTADSGKTFKLNVGDTLAVALPAASGGATWVWTETPAGVVSSPVQTTQAVVGGTNEIDTFTASGNGTVALSASLLSPGNTVAQAIWTATVVSGNGINAPVMPTAAASTTASAVTG